MPLGIEQNNIAPELIQSNGQALVQNIRQIGQQISQHLTEIQTRRDLSSLGQEAQTLNPRSTDFPVQLTQLVSKHPLAIRDERGQMVLSILGKEHGAWQAEESDARAFNRAMALQTRRTQDAKSIFETEQDYKRTHPQFIPGVGVTTLEDPNDPTGNPNVLLPVAPRGVAAGPRVLGPGAVLVDPSGKQLATNPKPEGIPPVQAAVNARLDKKMKMDMLDRQDKQTQAEIEAAIRRRDALTKERTKITSATDPNGPYYDNTIKALEGEVANLRKRRMDIQKAIEGFEATPAEAIPGALGAAAAAQPDLGLPPVPADAAAAPAAPANDLVVVINPAGKQVQIKRSQLGAALQGGYKQQ